MALITNLISYWDMEDASGGITDIHGSNDGTEGGNPTYGETGIIGDAIDFNGDGYFELGDTPFDITDQLSISMWIKPDSFPHNQMPISKSYLAYEILIKGASWHAYINGDEMYLPDLDPTTEWQHVVFTYDKDGGDDNKILYVNGTNIGSETQTGTIDLNNSQLTLGRRPGQAGYDYHGLIDEVGIWDRILSPAEVTELYNSGAGLAYPFTVGTNMKVNISDVFKDVDSIQINIGDVWKDVTSIQQNIGDVWKTVF